MNASIDMSGLISDEIPDNDLRLIELLMDAHQRAARDNQNASTLTFMLALQGSTHFRQGVAAAMMTMGERHAPIRQARTVFEQATPEWIIEQIKTGMKIAGFGNSFHRGRVDPAFDRLYSFLAENYNEDFLRLAQLTTAIWDSGKKIYPNAAMFTAIVCKIIKFPHGPEELLFVLPRMPVWAAMGMLPTAKPKHADQA